MSTFLNPYTDSIPMGYSPAQALDVITGHLTANGWQVIGSSPGAWADLIPPSGEAIGNAKFREVVRIYVANDKFTIGSYQQCIADAFPQSIRLTAKTAGAVAASVTIDGVTVTGAAGTSSSTANDNLRALYYALKDSADPVIQGWEHWYNGTDTVICSNKAITTAKAVTVNANVTLAALDAPVLSGAVSNWACITGDHAPWVSLDLANGTIYFLSVFTRSFVLGTKTLAGSSGAIFAAYLDHAQAMAQLPDSPRCSPIELLVGGIGDDIDKGWCKPTHYWAIGSKYSGGVAVSATIQTALAGSSNPTGEWHPFTGGGVPGAPQDCTTSYSVFQSSPWPTALEISAGLVGGVYTAGVVNIGGASVAPMGCRGHWHQTSASYAASARWTGIMLLPDVFKWVGSEPNETCAISVPLAHPGLNGVGITLQQALDATTAYTSILLSTVTGLPSAGSVVIGLEEFSYTGTSGGNTLTGAARAQNGTVAARHFVGDVVQPVTWFLKHNTGALMFGGTKPF